MNDILKTRNNFSDLIDNMDLFNCAEVGVQSGEFSNQLLKSKKLKKLHLIDCWQHQLSFQDGSANVEQKKQDELYEFVKHRFKNDSRVNIIKKFSKDAMHEFHRNSLDFIYIDANHQYEEVRKDIQMWYTKLKKDGILAGHDYFNGISFDYSLFGVKRAVDEFVNLNNFKLYTTTEDVPFISWYFRKTKLD
jgi:hypothetical protein